MPHATPLTAPATTMAQDARDELLLQHYELARRIAYRMYHRLPQLLEPEDLVSAAVMGLFESIDRYDASRGVPFEAFAKHRMQGAIMDALRAADWTPTSVRRKADLISRTRNDLIGRLGRAPTRKEMAGKLEVRGDQYDALVTDSEIKKVTSFQSPAHATGTATLAEVVKNKNEVDALEDMATEELRKMVRDASSELPDRERTAIDLHYYRDMKLKEVGATLGVTESRACQLCKQGIVRLRKRLQSHIH